MKIFITEQDLDQLDPEDPNFEVVRRHLVLMSDLYPENGYLVLVEEGDTERPLALPEVQRSWVDIILLSEGCIKRDGFYLLTYLTNNSFGIDLILPYAVWLSEDIKAALDAAQN